MLSSLLFSSTASESKDKCPFEKNCGALSELRRDEKKKKDAHRFRPRRFFDLDDISSSTSFRLLTLPQSMLRALSSSTRRSEKALLSLFRFSSHSSTNPSMRSSLGRVAGAAKGKSTSAVIAGASASSSSSSSSSAAAASRMLRAQRPATLRPRPRPPSFATGASMAMLRRNRKSDEEEEGFPLRPSPVAAAAAARNGSAADRAAAGGNSTAPLLLLSPDTPLAEALISVSSSGALSAADEFAIDRLRARGVDSAGSLFDLVREELGPRPSSAPLFLPLSPSAAEDSAAAEAVATITRLPSSVVAAVCAGVEAALRKGGGDGGNQVVASVPRRKSSRAPAAAAAAPRETAAALKKKQQQQQREREEEEQKNNVLTFRQFPDPSLRGAAAASANGRELRAPPTDPRWAARATSGSSGSSSNGGGGGGMPSSVDDAVRAVLTRRTPQGDRYFHGDPAEVRVTKAGRSGSRGMLKKDKVPNSSSPVDASYALHARDTPPGLARELDDFLRFWTVRFPGQQQQPVALVTAEKYVDHLRRMLGWAVSEGKIEREGAVSSESEEENLPLSESTPRDLSLRDLIPDSSREGASLVMEYAAWLARARGVSPHTEGLAVRSALSAAKFLFHSESKARVAAGERPYQDLEVVAELRGMSREAREAGRRAPAASDEDAKWLDWPDFLAVVEELRREAGAVNERGRRRTDAAVAWALQRVSDVCDPGMCPGQAADAARARARADSFL